MSDLSQGSKVKFTYVNDSSIYKAADTIDKSSVYFIENGNGGVLVNDKIIAPKNSIYSFNATLHLYSAEWIDENWQGIDGQWNTDKATPYDYGFAEYGKGMDWAILDVEWPYGDHVDVSTILQEGTIINCFVDIENFGGGFPLNTDFNIGEGFTFIRFVKTLYPGGNDNIDDETALFNSGAKSFGPAVVKTGTNHVPVITYSTKIAPISLSDEGLISIGFPMDMLDFEKYFKKWSNTYGDGLESGVERISLVYTKGVNSQYPAFIPYNIYDEYWKRDIERWKTDATTNLDNIPLWDVRTSV